MISHSLQKSVTNTLRSNSRRSAQRWVATASSTNSSSLDSDAVNSGKVVATAAALAAMATAGYVASEEQHPQALSTNTKLVACEQQQQQPRLKMLSNSLKSPTSIAPAGVEVRTTSKGGKLPVFSSKQVAVNNGQNGKPVWMSYGGNVYDVTNFIHNHPGGSEKILQAAGSSVEPFWHVYRQHFATDLPMKLLEQMLIGELLDRDQEQVDLKMEILAETTADPYALEPLAERNPALIVHSEQPMNAEVPEHLLTKDYLTPPDLFYIRHHHPVPYLTHDEVQNFELEIDLGSAANGKAKKTISLRDLQKMPKVEVTATLQCSGNRRGGYNDFERTSGTSWGQGAISTAKWGGVRLRDLLKHMGLEDEIDAQENGKLEHVRFHAMDGMMASIGIEKAMNPYGDVILCYEMNGKPLPRDHGYPLRIIVPGYAAVRNVKWVQKIELSTEEAEGPWQRGLNYKVLPPGVKDAKNVDLSKIPSMTELSVQSGITKIVPLKKSSPKPGDTIQVKASGWAYSGGGRNIVRVDVTGDGAQTWQAATLVSGQDQKQGRAWAWTFWECELPAVVQSDGSVQVHSKGVDLAFNSQPDSAKHNWNVRGLTNNSWYSKKIPVQ